LAEDRIVPLADSALLFTMDDCRTTTLESERTTDALVRQLRAKRKQLQQLLELQRNQTQTLESALEDQFSRLRAAVSEAGSRPAVDVSEIESQRSALATESLALAELSQTLELRQSELLQFELRLKNQEQSIVEEFARQQSELDERAAELDQASSQIRHAQKKLAATEEELAVDREQVAKLRERLQEQLRAVEHERESLATRRSETNAQRRRIAKELHQQRATQKAELSSERQRLQADKRGLESESQNWQSEYERQIEELQKRREELRLAATATEGEANQQLTELLAEIADLRRQASEHVRQEVNYDEQLETLRGELASATKVLAETRGECQRLEQAADASALDRTQDEETLALRRELATLRAQLEQAQTAAPLAVPDEADNRKWEDMKRRFELALEDLRDLKHRNAELEDKLSHARTNSASPDNGAANGKGDWEAQKRRLLASLEADDEDEEDSDSRDQRMSIEGAIRITDEIVARKDQEIAELKRVLDDQSSNLGSVAVGANAIAEILDQDELILQERENLKRIQEEWQQKLRQAEIDISLERARMARERLDLDEKMQSLQAERDKFLDVSQGAKGEMGTANQRRWWARLGLKEQD
jgi:chromosome segregation ATPase